MFEQERHVGNALETKMRNLEGTVGRLQNDFRSRLDFIEERLANGSGVAAGFDDRLDALERDFSTNSFKVQGAFESLSSRATQLGEELANMPTPEELHAAVRRLQDLSDSTTAGIEILRTKSNEHVEFASCVQASLDAFEQRMLACEGSVGQLKSGLGECVRVARVQNLEDKMNRCVVSVWGRDHDISRDMQPLVSRVDAGEDRVTELKAGVAQDVRVIQESIFRVRKEVADVFSQCVELQKDISSKADVAHTHERLVSSDGQVSFVI